MTEGKKHDSGKLRYDLFPAEAMEAIVKVLTKGAEKYDDNNWKHVDNARDRYYAALMRHVEADRMGEVFDDEWDFLHLAHAATDIIFLLQLRIEQADQQCGVIDEEKERLVQKQLHRSGIIMEPGKIYYSDTRPPPPPPPPPVVIKREDPELSWLFRLLRPKQEKRTVDQFVGYQPKPSPKSNGKPPKPPGNE